MKKTFKQLCAMVLALVMCVALFLPVAAEETIPACPGEGKQHTYTDAEVAVLLAHGLIEEIEKVEPNATSCASSGYTVFKCLQCNDMFVALVVLSDKPHDWKKVDAVAATCTTPGAKEHYECKNCGKMTFDKNNVVYVAEKDITIAKLGHKWVKVDETTYCDKDNTWYYECERCGAKWNQTQPAVDHTWVIKEIVKEPTVNEQGLAIYKCANCPAEKEVKILEQKLHTIPHEYTYVPAKASICDEAGNQEYYECIYCGKRFKVVEDAQTGEKTVGEEFAKDEEILPKADHVYDEANHHYKAPTHTEYGYDYWVCVRCGKILSNPGTDTYILPPDHVVLISVNKPNDYSKHYYQCADLTCPYHVGNEEGLYITKEHKIETRTVAATCNSLGYIYTYCTEPDCPYNKTDFYANKDNGISYDVRLPLLDPDGKELKDEQGNVLKDEEGVQLVSITFTPVDPTKHDMRTGIIKAVTCTEDGYTLEYCANCDKADKVITVKATGHKYDENDGGWIANEGKQCNAKDYEKRFCTVCETWVTRSREGTGKHNMVVTQETLTTCAAKGKTTSVCTFCGKVETKTKTDTFKYDPINKGNGFDLEEAKTLHPTLSTDYTIYREGNCVLTGLYRYTCSKCGVVYVRIPGTGEGHVDDFVYDASKGEAARVAPTCTTAGKAAKFWCDKCGLFVTTSADSDEDGVIAPLGHDFTAEDAYHKANAPKCGVAGNVEYWHCARCGKNFDGNTNAAKEIENVTIAALKHDWKTVPAKPRSCTEDGYTQYKVCTKCGEENGKTVLPKVPHYVWVWVALKDEKGNVIKNEDGSDKMVYVETDVVNFNQGIESPYVLADVGTLSCTKPGYDHYVCQFCNEQDGEFLINYVTPLGHDLVDQPAVDPTCVTVGNKAYKACSRCDYTEGFVTVPTTPHITADGVKFFADCTDPIWATVDGDEIDCVNPEHMGKAVKTHNLVTVEYQPTCYRDGYIVTYCTECDYVEIDLEVPADKPTDYFKQLKHNFVEDFDQYTAPTDAAEGKRVYYCAYCGLEKVVSLPKYSKLTITATADNAIVSKADYVDSTIIAIKVTLSAQTALIWGVNFDMNYDAQVFEYVKHEFNAETKFENALLSNKVTYADAKNTIPQNGTVTVVAYVPNDVNGNMQNVNFEGSETLVTIYFKVKLFNPTAYNYGQEEVFAFDVDTAGVANAAGQNVNTEWKNAGEGTKASDKIVIKRFLDVNADTYYNIADLNAIMNIITKKSAANPMYKAAADIDKDGDITMADFALMLNYLARLKTYADMTNA